MQKTAVLRILFATNKELEYKKQQPENIADITLHYICIVKMLDTENTSVQM